MSKLNLMVRISRVRRCLYPVGEGGPIVMRPGERVSRATSILFTFILVAASFFAPPVECNPDRSVDSTVVQFIGRTYFHGVPYEDAAQLGPSAFPTLQRMLEDPANAEHWSRIAAAVGVLGVPESFETLRSFVWRKFRGPVDEPTFRALLIAQASIGYIPPTSDKRVVEYLASCVNPMFWMRLPWTFGNLSAPQLSLILSKQSINALSYTGTTEADSVLAWLADHPYAKQQGPNVSEGLPRNRDIRAKGLLKYMQEKRAASHRRP
jgi:hypothetical protein